MRKLIIILWLFLNQVFLFSEIISFYQVKFVNEDAKIDGMLDEDCWKKVDFTESFYAYLSKKPVPPQVKTSFGIFYNQKGLYIGIINYDENVEKIRATRYLRDDPLLWMDDCNEIYLDPEAKGIGYTKFITTFLGTKYDEKRTDAQLTDAGWNGENWIYRTSKEKDKWIVEIFLPWSDIGKKAKKDDIWKFNITRFCFTGKSWLTGATWSLGATYMSSDKFGYLYFSDEKMLDMEKICDFLSDILSPGWELPSGQYLYFSETKGKWKKERMNEIFEKEEKQVKEIFSEIDGMIGDFEKNKAIFNEYKSLKENLEKIYGESELTKIAEIKELKDKIHEFYWKIKIEKEFK